MISQIVVAVAVMGALFSMSAMAIEFNDADDKKRRAGKVAAQAWEPVVSIHNAGTVLAHPTTIPSGEQSIAELRRLQGQGESREMALRAWYQSQGRDYPERFYGD